MQFLQIHDSIKFILVEGNHDIIENYPIQLKVIKSYYDEPFVFTHIKENTNGYNLSGHIHPGVSVTGKGRQSITLSCFLFSSDHAILPAFGQFTGIKKIRPKKKDRVFGIAEDKVIELS